MIQKQLTRLPEILSRQRESTMAEWTELQIGSGNLPRNMQDEREIRSESEKFLNLFLNALNGLNGADPTDIQAPQWSQVRDMLEDLSRSRAIRGYTPSETATFVFSLKQPVFNRLREDLRGDADALAAEIWAATLLLDKLGLFTTEIHQKGREEMINRQQREMMELSTPVVELWDGILALPLIGTLDSSRTQVVMQSLLEKIVATGSAIAIIDITGVPTVDTLVAQHLLKTVAAARLMGADCIISGIRPQIAQTIVHLGVELSDVATKASLSSAFILALKRVGRTVTDQTPAK
jgi:rsbT co-antagonist protein RsbR